MKLWNPWHGCHKISEGCAHCYMYHMDKKWDRDSSIVTRNKSNFRLPLKKHRDGTPYVQNGELLQTCLTSDFFIEEADPWRQDAWDIIRKRPDVAFSLLTKRIGRVREYLPPDWGDGWDNVQIGVSCENQSRADERIPVLLSIPAKHRWAMCAPLIGPVDLSPWLKTGKLRQVLAGGENYDGCRPCRHEWIEDLSRQCRECRTQFCFVETGTNFWKDGKQYWIPGRHKQGYQARLSGLSFRGDPEPFGLRMPDGSPIPEELRYRKRFHPVTCATCAQDFICNGCDGCGNCCC